MSNKEDTEINHNLLRLIVCPITGGKIYYDSKKNVVVSKSAKLYFPVRNGIPILVRSEAKPFTND